MSFGIDILLTEKRMTGESYARFLRECSSILGDWHVHVLDPFNSNSEEVVHDCFLVRRPAERKTDVRVKITLYRRQFSKKYGRGRKKFYWAINTETGAGSDFLSYAIQLLIPLKAFNMFSDIVVIVAPERVFLHPENYRSCIVGELEEELGHEALEKVGLYPKSDEGLLKS